MAGIWERYYCPFCARRGKTPDTKGKLYINWTTKYFLCFRCSVRGHTSSLDATSLVPYRGFLGSSSKQSATWDIRRFVEYSLDEVQHQFPHIYSLLQRKNALHKFPIVKIAFFSSGEGLCLPLSNNKFQIRLFSTSEGAPKYLTQAGFNKIECAEGFKTLRGSSAILVEGIFDYYRLEGLAICMFGHFVNDQLVNRLLSAGVGRIILFLDDDSHEISVEEAVSIYLKHPFVEVYSAFCLDGSPADTKNLKNTPCLNIKTQTTCKLKDLVNLEVLNET